MKNILLIGAGRFGRHMAEQLTQLGHQVMAVDTNEERINDLLGTQIDAEEMLGYFKALEFDYEQATETLIAPTFRQDIEGFADVAEEIGRAHV